MSMHRWWRLCVVAVTAAACGQEPTSANLRADIVDSILARTRQTRVAALAARADLALAYSVRLDYRRPMAGEPLRRDDVRDAYREACQAGDRRACEIAPTIFDRSPHAAVPAPPAYTEPDRDGCRAGQLAACEALNAAALARLSASLHDLTIDPEPINADLALSGTWLCELRFDCADLWAPYEHTDQTRARDAAERACQYDATSTAQRDACETLVSRYLNLEDRPPSWMWPEPVPGRARALQAWLDQHR